MKLVNNRMNYSIPGLILPAPSRRITFKLKSVEHFHFPINAYAKNDLRWIRHRKLIFINVSLIWGKKKIYTEVKN